MFTNKRGMCANKGDNSKFIFARIMPLFELGIFYENSSHSQGLASSALVSFLLCFQILCQKSSLFGKGLTLTLSQATYFRCFQTERVGRRQFQI